VQTILQFGDQSQKDLILARLCEKASEVSKTPYGHFTILKAITYCTHAGDQRKIAASLKNHFVSLGMRMMMMMMMMMILMVMMILLFLLLVVMVMMMVM
jgi:ABC-type bacteriocin/lantibiotic exporter with double-glycine peptidase domain